MFFNQLNISWGFFQYLWYCDSFSLFFFLYHFLYCDSFLPHPKSFFCISTCPHTPKSFSVLQHVWPPASHFLFCDTSNPTPKSFSVLQHALPSHFLYCDTFSPHQIIFCSVTYSCFLFPISHFLSYIWKYEKNRYSSWLVDFNSISTRLSLFYAQRWGNNAHCMLKFTHFCS